MKFKPILTAIITAVLLFTGLSATHAAPPAQTEMAGEEYIVQADDWLSKLADKFYGDIFAYPTIVEATNAKAAEDDSFTVIDNPDVIEIGQKLWIPATPDGEMAAGDMEAEETAGDEMEEGLDSSLPGSYALPGESVFPEGVAFNQTTGKFYVGSTTDGTLYEGDLASGEVTIFSPAGADGRTTAIGLKVDDGGNLWVSGGGTGQVFAYNTADGGLLASYTTPAVEQTFINDATITPDGSVYFTDSFRPVLFKISEVASGEAESWLDFTGTVLEYGEGFNLNGIAATADGRFLLVIHSGTGSLYRIDTETQEVIQVDTGDADLTAGDGILLVGTTLYVTRNRFGEIVPVAMAEEFSAGTAGNSITDPSLIFPTTIARAGDSLLVVNSQFNNRGGTPELPFTVSRIPLPN